MRSIVISAILIIILTVVIINNMNRDNVDIVTDEDSVKWDGYKPTEQPRNKAGYISIPGINKLVFKASETIQDMNIYNPGTNDADIVFSLTIGDEEIWKSGRCKPGDGYYMVSIMKPLDEGRYGAKMHYDCYRGLAKLNGAVVDVELIVQ